MERRQLDRDAVIGEGVARRRVAPDPRDRRGIAAQIAPRILRGARRLAEHDEARELAFLLVGALDRGVYALAHSELLAEQLHRRERRLADHGVARTAHHRLAQGQRGTAVVRVGKGDVWMFSYGC